MTVKIRPAYLLRPNSKIDKKVPDYDRRTLLFRSVCDLLLNSSGKYKEMHPRERRDAREPKGAAVASGRRGSSGRAVKRQEQGREQQDDNRNQINIPWQ